MFYQANHIALSVCRESLTKYRTQNTSSHDKCRNLVLRVHSLNPGNEVEDIRAKISISVLCKVLKLATGSFIACNSVVAVFTLQGSENNVLTVHWFDTTKQKYSVLDVTRRKR